MNTDTTIGFIGAGHMAGSLIEGLLTTHHPDNIKLSNGKPVAANKQHKRFAVGMMTNEQVARYAEVVILAVRPDVVPAVCGEIAPYIKRDTLIISVAAGVATADIEAFLNKPTPIVRAMPNMASQIKLGATGAYANAHTLSEQKECADGILRAVGLVEWLDKEETLNVVTALSGSGPAYFFLMLEAMIKSAVKLGLDQKNAEVLALQTALGASKLALLGREQGVSCEQLKRSVMSAGGTTEAAINSLVRDGIEASIDKAIQAAHKRSVVMGAELASAADNKLAQ